MSVNTSPTKLENLFIKCNARLPASLLSIVQFFWAFLDNRIDVVSLYRVFRILGANELDLQGFSSFFTGLAKTKYPIQTDYLDRFICECTSTDDFPSNTGPDSLLDFLIERDVLLILSKFDAHLKRVYACFAGQSEGITWIECSERNIAMEFEGFISFAGAFSIIPKYFDVIECEGLVKSTVNLLPLRCGLISFNRTIYFPQFQLLLCRVAYSLLQKYDGAGPKIQLSQFLQNFFNDIGLRQWDGNQRVLDNTLRSTPIPSPIDTDYIGNSSNSRESLLLRLDAMFTIVEETLISRMGSFMLPVNHLAYEDKGTNRLLAKPVVISDALPVPSICSPDLQDLLESALALHNLGSHAKSLQYLETARMRISEPSYSVGVTDTMQAAQDIMMYIFLCKGNVYQSCGDDGNALSSYMLGWNQAKGLQVTDVERSREWESVYLNAIGILAYYNARYTLSFLCFTDVDRCRLLMYGQDSPDRMTVINNESCCLFCLGDRGEAKVRLERAYSALSNTLGFRAVRVVQVWKNLEMVRKAGSTTRRRAGENLAVTRTDASKLIAGGSFEISATAPAKIMKSQNKKKMKGSPKKK